MGQKTRNNIAEHDLALNNDILLRLSEFATSRTCCKAWIIPANEIVPLKTFHYEYFRNPEISRQYGVPFRDEHSTRLGALRVGFARMNYQLNGGFLTIETMRWDRALRKLVNGFIIKNADALDLVRINKLDMKGVATQIATLCLFDLRRVGIQIQGIWKPFRERKVYD